MMKRLATALAAILVLVQASTLAEEIRTVSPDKTVAFTVAHDDGGLTCRLPKQGYGKPVLSRCIALR